MGITALAFLIGEWELDYTVTRQGNTTRELRGTGSIRYALDDKYVLFDYEVRRKADHERMGQAHGVFAWDEKAGQYRYFWFESSGAFLQATASMNHDDTLVMQWQGANCTQIFHRVDADAMYLEMRCPDEDLLLRVDFARQIGVRDGTD